VHCRELLWVLFELGFLELLNIGVDQHKAGNKVISECGKSR
jgi:hypothetical protein